MSQSTELTVFTAPGGERLRVALLNDEPWFFANDVCASLDIANVGNALARLDEDEKSSIRLTDGTPGSPVRGIVSEPGLYALIMRSDKPEAKAFRRWVTHEVLPAIRRSGGYSAPVVPPTRRELALAILAAEDERDAALKALASVSKDLEDTEHVVERMTASSGCLSFGQAAQTLGYGRQTFIAHLGRLGMIILRPGTSDHLRPYQNQLRAGRFEVEAQSYEHPEEGTQVVSRTRVTPKGLVHIAKELLNEGKLHPRGKTWFAAQTSKESR